MDAGTIATIVGIVLLIILQVASMIFRSGSQNQRTKAVEKAVFDDGLVDKVSDLQISAARMETKQDTQGENINRLSDAVTRLVEQRANPGSAKSESDKLPK